MKKIFFAILILSASACVQAQMTTSFPLEKNDFVKAMDNFMKANKLENCEIIADEFQKSVKQGELNDQMLEQVIKTSNTMANRVMSPFPYFYNYLTAVLAFAKAKGPADQFATWNNICQEVAKNQKKGDNKDFTKMMDFSVALFSKGAVSSTASKTWKVESKDYKLSIENGKPVLRFPVSRFYGITNGDTVSINKTSGEYYPLENKWYGKGGVVDWSKVGLNPNTVYANIKKDYTIALDNFTYKIDSVEFFHKEFFQTPLNGSFTDKLVAGNDSSALYPRFDSKDQNITIKEIAPNVSFTGGFNLYGSKVIGYGTPEEKASVTFFLRDNKTRILTARFLNFTIKKGEELSSTKAEVFLFNGADTIYHPELTMIYKVAKRDLKLLRGETSISRSKFLDSYHNQEFDVDAIFWNLDSTRLQLKTLNGVGQVGSNFESNNYFSKERIRKLQGTASYEPLSVIKRLYEKNGTRELNALDVAKALDPSLKEEQAKTLFYQLVEMGFIKYDEPNGIITIRDKIINYVMSNAKKIDYDILRIKSVPKDGVDYIDLKNNNVELKGVGTIPISDTANVFVFPKDKFVKIQKDRNMEFNGTVYAGRMDFFGNNYKFNYAPFTMDLSGLDSMRINIPNGDRLDENGQPVLMTLRTNIDGIKGLLEVDAPINKSGRARLLQFPKLTSREKSYARYDDPNIAGRAYKRDQFYFEVDPFKLDSLNTFTPSVINWKGKLVSGGIFPDIPESIKILPDLSLGFNNTTPPAGLALYKDGGKYQGDIALNFNGLSGNGKINHLTSEFSSKGIMFYLDSLKAVADTFHIAKTTEGVKTPEVSSTGNVVYWKPKADSMLIQMKDKPFAMYDNQTTLKGNLMLTSKGLKGNGLLDWAEANLASKDFKFKTDDMSADTSELNIKSTFGDKVTFKTPNVQAKIDFKNHIGDFKSNLANNPTDFAYNQYKTNITEFKWDIDKKILDFKAPAGGKGEYFTSTRESQMGLQFLGKRATYNLATSVLKVEQVSEIIVADARVIPDSGIVIIQGEAKMDQLKKATILVDTLTAKHKIEKCTVDIISKAELRGSGEYKYSTKDHPNQLITFNEIKCTKEVVGTTRKNQFIDWSLVAKGTIEEKAKFFLYPDVSYKGDAFLYGRNPDLFFKGFAKINFKNPNVNTSDFTIADDANPDNMIIHFDTTAKSSEHLPVNAGINYNKSLESPGIYTNVMGTRQNPTDISIFKAAGIIVKNPTTGEYSIGNEDRINNGSLRGNILKYNDEKGIVKGEGNLNLGADFGLIKTVAAGTFENDLAKKSYQFNLTFGLDMRTENKALEEKLQTIMFNDNTDLNDISYESDKFKMALKNLSDDKVDDKLLKEFETNQIFKRPKALTQYLVFSDVNFVYDPTDVTIRSYGKIGLAFVGERAIHKRLEGYIEIGLRPGADYFNIYLKTGANEWFFFEYRPGILGLVSSYDDFNRIIGSLDATKRVVKGDNNRFYTYGIGSTINKSTFTDAMKEKVNPLLPAEKSKPKPVVVPKDSTNKTVAPSAPKTEPEKIAPEKKEETTPTAPEKKAEQVPPQSAQERRAEAMRKKAGQTEQKPDAPIAPVVTPDSTKQIVPVIPVTTPSDTVKKQTAPTVAPTPSATDTIKKPIEIPVVPIDTTQKK